MRALKNDSSQLTKYIGVSWTGSLVDLYEPVVPLRAGSIGPCQAGGAARHGPKAHAVLAWAKLDLCRA